MQKESLLLSQGGYYYQYSQYSIAHEAFHLAIEPTLNEKMKKRSSFNRSIAYSSHTNRPFVEVVQELSDRLETPELRAKFWQKHKELQVKRALSLALLYESLSNNSSEMVEDVLRIKVIEGKTRIHVDKEALKNWQDHPDAEKIKYLQGYFAGTQIVAKLRVWKEPIPVEEPTILSEEEMVTRAEREEAVHTTLIGRKVIKYNLPRWEIFTNAAIIEHRIRQLFKPRGLARTAKATS